MSYMLTKCNIRSRWGRNRRFSVQQRKVKWLMGRRRSSHNVIDTWSKHIGRRHLSIVDTGMSEAPLRVAASLLLYLLALSAIWRGRNTAISYTCLHHDMKAVIFYLLFQLNFYLLFQLNFYLLFQLNFYLLFQLNFYLLFFKFDYYLSIIAKSKCHLCCINQKLTVHIFVMVHCTYSYQVHCTYSYQVHLSYQIHLYTKYIFISSTFLFQVHLHAKYISMPSTSPCQVHLHAKYIFVPNTHSYHVHPLAMYIFTPSTHSYHVHIHTKYIVHIYVKYIFVSSTYSYQEHFRTKYTSKPSTHLRYRWLASCCRAWGCVHSPRLLPVHWDHRVSIVY